MGLAIFLGGGGGGIKMQWEIRDLALSEQGLSFIDFFFFFAFFGLWTQILSRACVVS